MSILASGSSLPREQQRAIDIYYKHKDNFFSLLDNSERLVADGPILPTNFVATKCQPFEKASLPKEPHWVWTQSNSKISIILDANTVITFRKLNPRKRFGSLRAPSYKIWLYQIQCFGSFDKYFLWCEKGTKNPQPTEWSGVNTSIGFVFPQNLSIYDLSFLSPFVDQRTAQELGWLNEHV